MADGWNRDPAERIKRWLPPRRKLRRPELRARAMSRKEICASSTVSVRDTSELLAQEHWSNIWVARPLSPRD